MQSDEIRQHFLEFFEKRGHAILPSASLVPENDPSVLFTTAGMQPLAPYLMGAEHPKGRRLANVQKCVRTQDIEEVGDNTHDTFFEMLGNWSLGDPASPDGIGAGYFKEDAIKWSYEFLTSKSEGLGLDPARFYITVFEGNSDAPRDMESVEIWKRLGIPEHRIYFQGAEDNWWSPGDDGPCGPDTEMFYDVTEEGLGDMTFEEFKKADDEQKAVEMWNDVFMEYEKKGGKIVGQLKQKNVDTGAGLERLAMVIQGKDNIFDTDLFAPIVASVERGMLNVERGNEHEKAVRIIADHMRTAVFMIADGVVPSNTDRGYILRRLIRRAVRYGQTLGMEYGGLRHVAEAVADKYAAVYTNVSDKKDTIFSEIEKEAEKFRNTLAKGMKEFKKIATQDIGGQDAFTLFSTYGFPVEMTEELAKEKGVSVDVDGFWQNMEEHRQKSRAGAAQKFEGGLADDSEEATMLHTATHLLLAGLRKYVGKHVHQAGSNITKERTRLDFTHDEKVDRAVLSEVEKYVNEAIQKKCGVVIERMPKEKAQESGVEGSFWEKYPDEVDVYTVRCGDDVYSRELCGGPHVKNTGDIKGTFKIVKEEASSAGVRRVKAVLE